MVIECKVKLDCKIQRIKGNHKRGINKNRLQHILRWRESTRQKA